ncbi:MAG: redoxin domain-containing protein [Candidatus Pedobacter colombiensis]|uniref:Redoxin domain-containing protein n=1 Tax=Candidatus Pedobacter colombiensis TaxID=3121371 RepID=A0AAJ5W668_9SPHI|nr:redoxin domain-containing protein [Pedobacter sp.]WEK17875.1 MAG: redoxin domain-containing protein [Pedobacter sp.]
MKKTTIYIVLALLCLNFKVNAQDKIQMIQPLKIGDTIPEILRRLPLEVINQRNGERNTRLNDFKNKLIILDFWGRSCAPCIKALPKLDSLNVMFEDDAIILPISDFNSESELRSTLERFKIQTLSIHGLENKTLLKYFPHQLQPHLVWIDKDWRICAITTSEYVTPTNISRLLNGLSADWPSKQDVLDYNSLLPIISINVPERAKPEHFLYSVFTTHLNGISPKNGKVTDSVNQATTTTYYNMRLLSFISMALDNKIGAPVEQFDLQVKDKSRFIMDKAENYSEWAIDNTFCYSIRLPIQTTPKVTQMLIQQDLIKWISLLGLSIKKVSVNKQNQKKYLVTENNN